MSSSGHCRCSLLVRLVGDGCKYCNPEKALQYAEESIEDLATRVRNWLKESPMSERISRKRCMELRDICNDYDGMDDESAPCVGKGHAATKE